MADGDNDKVDDCPVADGDNDKVDGYPVPDGHNDKVVGELVVVQLVVSGSHLFLCWLPLD